MWFLLSPSGNPATRSFDDFALDEQTLSVFAKLGDVPIHGQYLDTIDPCIEAWKQRGSREVILWLGNSQLHAINQASTQSEPAPAKLFSAVSSEGLDLLTFSQPNASLQEHYVLLSYLSTRLPVDTLLLAMVFDDLRETGIRPQLRAALDEPNTRHELSATEIGNTILNQYLDAADPTTSATGDPTAIVSWQDRSEAFLDQTLEDNWSLWASRPHLRGVFLTELYFFRNQVFGISAQSKRKMIPGASSANLDAFAAIIDLASRRDIQVIPYIVPLRSDIPNPYVEDQYEAFKTRVRDLSRSGGLRLWNLEDIVPGSLWGTLTEHQSQGAQLDFMHFQEGGHERLARALEERLIPILRGRGR